MKPIVLIGTLDTKGHEIRYLKERIEEKGLSVLVIDAGVLGQPLGVMPEISREEVARAAGTELSKIQGIGRGHAIDVMIKGLEKVVQGLYREGRLGGVLSIGGGEGTHLGCAAMRALPLGVPKLMVSTMASGQITFGEYTGTKDIAIMHSVVDILGINAISRKIFDNAAGAIAGMVQAGVSPVVDRGEGPIIAATMYGNTTPAVMRAKALLEQKGYQVVVFHCNGTGGRAMEEMIRQGLFHAVLDYSTHELTDELCGGRHSAGPSRLEAAAEMGVPQLIVPGCLDFITLGAPDTLPERYASRPSYYHNPTCTLVRTSREEMEEVGRIMASKLNPSTAAVRVMVPLGGLSMPNVPGGEFHDPEADGALLRALKEGLREDIPVTEHPYHINDPQFVDLVVSEFQKILVSKEAGQDGRKTV